MPAFRSMPTRLALFAVAMMPLGACGGADTPATLIVGEWDQQGVMTIGEGPMAMTTRETEREFTSDGTSASQGIVEVSALPENADEYRMRTEGTYRVEGNIIFETVTSVTVEPLDSGEQAQNVARMIQAASETQMETRTEIVSIDTQTVVVRPEGTDLRLTFRRD